jgi:glycosyltransferase involved in cell wall biosynthesis
MRVALVALQVRGSMGQYLDALAHSLGRRTDLHLFVPEHYAEPNGPFTVHRFVTGATRGALLRSMMNPVPGWRVWQAIRSVQPDVVHLFNGEGSPWSLLWVRLARAAGISFGLTLHDPDSHPGDPMDTLQAFLGRDLVRHADWVHIHTRQFIDTVVQRGVPRDHIVVIPHGSLAPRFLQHRQPGVAREGLALCFGRLVSYKGLDLLVEAGILLAGQPRIAIAGPGKLADSLQRRIASHPAFFELHNRYVSDEDVAHLFQRSSVCVMPYRHATQSSLPLISAAFGVPLVATALGGLIEDVPRVHGLMVPSNDCQALVTGIREAAGRTPYYPRELEFDYLSGDFLMAYERLLGRQALPAL